MKKLDFKKAFNKTGGIIILTIMITIIWFYNAQVSNNKLFLWIILIGTSILWIATTFTFCIFLMGNEEK